MKIVKPTDLPGEIAFPLTSGTVLMSILVFGSLLWLSVAAGMLGLWLMFIVVPALFRYAIYLLEARAHGKETLVAGIEIFNIADNLWGLIPLILLGGFVWLEWQVLNNVSLQVAQALLVVFFLIYPASVAVLGVTRSPIDSINPVMLVRMIRTCGVNYVFIPIVLVFVTFVMVLLHRSVLPDFTSYYVGVYIFYLLFTFTGAVVHASDVVSEVDIDAPLARSVSEVTEDLIAMRQKTADHAYGFISRGNREGGFKHIREWIESEADPDEAVSWFFNEMMRWESGDAALFFAQECFAHFIHHDLDRPAIKLMTRCLYEDPCWKPRVEDRPHAIELAERYGMDDLVKLLRS